MTNRPFDPFVNPSWPRLPVEPIPMAHRCPVCGLPLETIQDGELIRVRCVGMPAHKIVTTRGAGVTSSPNPKGLAE